MYVRIYIYIYNTCCNTCTYIHMYIHIYIYIHMLHRLDLMTSKPDWASLRLHFTAPHIHYDDYHGYYTIVVISCIAIVSSIIAVACTSRPTAPYPPI